MKLLKILGPQGRGTQTWEGTLFHLPVGILAAALITFNPWHAGILTLVFLVYQVVEGISERDRAYRDIHGFMQGFAWSSIIQVVYAVLRWLEVVPDVLNIFKVWVGGL